MTLQDVDQSLDRAILERAITELRRLPYAEYLGTAHWQRQREYALQQAGQACELCGHRTNSRCITLRTNASGFERPEDLVVVCNECHTQGTR